MYLGLATLWALAVPLFVPADEKEHVDYAYQVGHGHLPLAGGPLHAQFPALGQRSGTQYVAYHPPLYYLLVSPLVRLGSGSTHPRLWLLAVRGFGILLAAASVVLVAVLARRVFAHWDAVRRTQLAVLAAGLVAVVPSMIGATASIMNDPLELILVVVAAVCLAGIVRSGVSLRRVVVIAVVCGLGMLSRVTYVQALVSVIVALTLSLILLPAAGRDPLPRGHRLRQAAGYLAIVAATPALMAGWFYLLNKDRYGSFTGSNVAYQLVAGRQLQPRMSGPFRFAFDPHSWWAQLLQLGGAGA
ncbi:MAG: hypothetical protein QOI26_988, partial [Pseudonocardiales bacterium]|nr:hypothetical protein [Pseudonocardiales bacterium]